MNHKKIALITGANKGIGLETARQLGKKGMTVLLGARDTRKGETAAGELRKDGIDAQPIEIDVSDPQSIKKLRLRSQATLGDSTSWSTTQA